MTPNPLDGLGAVLLADPAVTDLVTDRVFWPALDRRFNAGMPTPTVVLRPAGGYSRYGRGTLALTDPRIDVDCIAETLAQSWQIYLAIAAAAAAHRAHTAGGVLVKSIAVTAGGVTDVDPETKWPMTICSLTVTAATTPTSMEAHP